VVEHQHPAEALRGIDELAALLEGRSQWLLDEDVLARLQGCQHDCVVRSGRGGDGDGDDRRIVENLVERARRADRGVVADHLLGSGVVEVTQVLET